jgi:hypothetical protein
MAKSEKKVPQPVKQQVAGSQVSYSAIEKALIHQQNAQPHAEFIYVNAKGEYHLHARPGFTKVSTSEAEIIEETPVKAKTVKSEDVTGELPKSTPSDGLEF